MKFMKSFDTRTKSCIINSTYQHDNDYVRDCDYYMIVVCHSIIYDFVTLEQNDIKMKF